MELIVDYVVFFGCFIYVKVFSFFVFYFLYVLMYIRMIIRMLFNILNFYVWCYIIDELLLVIINNFVLNFEENSVYI